MKQSISLQLLAVYYILCGWFLLAGFGFQWGVHSELVDMATMGEEPGVMMNRWQNMAMIGSFMSGIGLVVFLMVGRVLQRDEKLQGQRTGWRILCGVSFGLGLFIGILQVAAKMP